MVRGAKWSGGRKEWYDSIRKAQIFGSAETIHGECTLRNETVKYLEGRTFRSTEQEEMMLFFFRRSASRCVLQWPCTTILKDCSY